MSETDTIERVRAAVGYCVCEDAAKDLLSALRPGDELPGGLVVIPAMLSASRPEGEQG